MKVPKYVVQKFAGVSSEHIAGSACRDIFRSILLSYYKELGKREVYAFRL